METAGTGVWGKIGPGLTSRLTPGVTDLTLDFGPMLVVSDKILQSAHIEALLGALAQGIMITCLNLSTFSVTINTTRNKGWEDKQEDVDLPTTDKQWRVIEQILGLIGRVV